MGFEVTDDELVRMSTSELRLLLVKRQLTPEEHRQLRSRRRRLQNRKYARKCAHKKLAEVENLTTEVEEETTELQTLRRQLFRINLTTQRLQHHATELARFRLSLQSQNSANPTARTIRMLLSDGKTVGFAKPAACPPHTVCSKSLCAPSASEVSIGRATQPCRDNVRPISLLLNSHSLCSVASSSCSFSSSKASMPVQLAAGLGMPSNQNPSPYAWSQSASSSLNSRLPMRLVRPVGCGIVANGRNRAEY